MFIIKASGVIILLAIVARVFCAAFGLAENNALARKYSDFFDTCADALMILGVIVGVVGILHTLIV